MPPILAPKDWELWLDPKESDPVRLQPLLRPFAGATTASRVSALVNNPKNDTPECGRPAG